MVETIEDFAGMKDSQSGLLPEHTVIDYNTSSIPLAATGKAKSKNEGSVP